MIQCPKCLSKNPMDGDRVPPWCRHCGADLKAALKTPAPTPTPPCAPASQSAPTPATAPAPGQALDNETVKKMVEPDPRKGPPVSRSYRHRSCKAVTKVTGDDHVLLECPFRPVDSTYCSRCQALVPLHDVEWEDSGE